MDNTLLEIPSGDELLVFEKESSPLKKVSLLTQLDQFIIHKIAKMLNPGSLAVEVGTYLGGSASLMAHANKHLEIHCYDLFDSSSYDPRHHDLMAMSLGKGSERSLENVKKYLSPYTNIFLHKVYKGDPAKYPISFFGHIDDRKIDMFIEDASHKEPQLTNSLAYWLPKVNINGFVLLHDYRPWLFKNHRLRHVDVEKQVENLSNNNDWSHIGNFSCFAIFQRVR